MVLTETLLVKLLIHSQDRPSRSLIHCGTYLQIECLAMNTPESKSVAKRYQNHHLSLTMPYATIQPPFTLKFREMSKQELKDYFRWFFDVFPERTRELAEAVKQTPGFETWRPDLVPASLGTLGNWFATQAETRQRAQEERQEIASRSAYPIEIPNDELTNRTFSLAMDVGMYLSQVLVKEHPSLRWEQPLKDKKFADYGQPILVGFGPVPLNPVRIAITLAYGLASKKQSGKRLRELHDYWSKQVRTSSLG